MLDTDTLSLRNAQPQQSGTQLHAALFSEEI